MFSSRSTNHAVVAATSLAAALQASASAQELPEITNSNGPVTSRIEATLPAPQIDIISAPQLKELVAFEREGLKRMSLPWIVKAEADEALTSLDQAIDDRDPMAIVNNFHKYSAAKLAIRNLFYGLSLLCIGLPVTALSHCRLINKDKIKKEVDRAVTRIIKLGFDEREFIEHKMNSATNAISTLKNAIDVLTFATAECNDSNSDQLLRKYKARCCVAGVASAFTMMGTALCFRTESAMMLGATITAVSGCAFAIYFLKGPIAMHREALVEEFEKWRYARDSKSK